MSLDQRGSIVLSPAECQAFLERAAAALGTGRLAVNGVRSPYLIPVNFSLVEGGILIRLGPGWAAFHLDGADVSFEVDEAVPTQRSGWSVVIEGVARVLPYEEAARLGANVPNPIVTTPGVRVFEVIPFKVTGRAVTRDLDAALPWNPTTKRSPQHGGGGSVMELHLDADEMVVLATLLHATLGDLSSEIAGTDNAAFKRDLLERRRLLDAIAARLTGGNAT